MYNIRDSNDTIFQKEIRTHYIERAKNNKKMLSLPSLASK
jgi:hypothetical protein